jgi:hypothetical protein
MAIPLFSASTVKTARNAAIAKMVGLGHTPYEHWVSSDSSDVFKATVFYCECRSCCARVFVYVLTLSYDGPASIHKCSERGAVDYNKSTLVSGYSEP